MGRLFGTDGARGVANTELTCELAMNIGRAAAMVLTEQSDKKPVVIIGKDTRLSSDMLEGAIVAGLCSVGADVITLGVVPTPAVALLVRKYKADAGIMISASHNPYEFNGIKIFSGTGFKLPDTLEEEIEAIVLDNIKPYDIVSMDKLGKVTVADTAIDEYINHVISTVPEKPEGLKVAFDCSNGSSSRTAQRIFEGLGVECHMTHFEPNGVNINKDCGSTHIDALAEYVKNNKLDCGIAFDGDADRCLAVDENGELIDGDFIIAMCALDLKERGLLKNNTAVGTVLTNMGFNKFCEENNINFNATKVGDRYVLESMVENGYVIGGEQSGHVIFLDYCTTGDGQTTASQLLSLMKRKNQKLSEIAKVMTRYPQVMINVKISPQGKGKVNSDEDVQAKVAQVSAKLEGHGRIIVRESGTEPLVRVMLEGDNYNEIEKLANETAEVVKSKLG
ncbi:MAG: phosphoglucosamine mutase [Acutalibacteraceae bacterium]|nr:phosphoglucosamine mutase [Acutalibacteraceae bacterium]